MFNYVSAFHAQIVSEGYLNITIDLFAFPLLLIIPFNLFQSSIINFMDSSDLNDVVSDHLSRVYESPEGIACAYWSVFQLCNFYTRYFFLLFIQ